MLNSFVLRIEAGNSNIHAQKSDTKENKLILVPKMNIRDPRQETFLRVPDLLSNDLDGLM